MLCRSNFSRSLAAFSALSGGMPGWLLCWIPGSKSCGCGVVGGSNEGGGDATFGCAGAGGGGCP